MNDLERDFVGDDDMHYEPGDEVDYEDMPGLINCEDNMDHLNIMHLYGDFNRFNDNENDYDCEEIKADLEADLKADLEADLKADLDTELNTDLDTDLNTELNTELKTDLNTELNTDLDTELDTELNTELKAELETGLNTDLETGLNTDLETGLNTDLETGLNAELKEIEPTPTQQEPDINREIEASPKQTCIII